MRQLFKNKEGNVQMIIMAIVAAITIAVSVVIVYSVMQGFATTNTNIDETLQKNMGYNASSSKTRPAYNASVQLQNNLDTFYTLSPILVVVLAAVGIIAAIILIAVRR